MLILLFAVIIGFIIYQIAVTPQKQTTRNKPHSNHNRVTDNREDEEILFTDLGDDFK